METDQISKPVLESKPMLEYDNLSKKQKKELDKEFVKLFPECEKALKKLSLYNFLLGILDVIFVLSGFILFYLNFRMYNSNMYMGVALMLLGLIVIPIISIIFRKSINYNNQCMYYLRVEVLWLYECKNINIEIEHTLNKKLRKIYDEIEVSESDRQKIAALKMEKE